MDAALAQVIATLDETRLAAHVYDAEWRIVHSTAAHRANVRWHVPPGTPVLSTTFTGGLREGGMLEPGDLFDYGCQLIPFIVGAHPGGRAAVQAVVDPVYHEAIASAVPQALPPLWTGILQVRTGGGARVPMRALVTPIERDGGGFAGAVELWLPNLSGDLLALLTLTDTEHLERLGLVARSRRRPSAILFADLEASTPLARRLSTEAYFRLIRRVMRAADAVIVRHGGLVGRHVGDGLTAFYPEELCGGEAGAARAALEAARELQAAVGAAAATVPNAGELHVNVGLHWGATVRLGALITAARFEVTALGEEVNEAARIEACATGGRVLASKALLERLDDDTIPQLGIDPDISYEALGDVAGAPDKARRDAPTLAVRPV